MSACTFIDTTRGVLDYSTTPATLRSNHRTFLTEIRYPIASRDSASSVLGAAPLARRGGYPVIIFAHGYDVTPDTYAALLDSWVRAGFVVVAPYFPDEKASAVTAQHGADTEGDLANEPGDIVYVTSQVVVASARLRPGCPVLHGLIRPTEIALAGHSDGGDAVAMLAYGHGADPQGVAYTSLNATVRYQAVLILAGAEVPNQRYAAEKGHPSLLLIQSEADTCNPIRQGAQLYRDVRQPNKWFFELMTAHHLPPFDGVDHVAFRDVVAVTTHFLESSLHVSQPTPGLMAYANRHPSVARMFDSQRGPTLAGLPTLVEACGTT
ncbi:MAG: hypothetical protein PXZ08_07980 [Actinomycetota bacterium]|nr:hypothetical protein [Actinomycetota bacterium]